MKKQNQIGRDPKSDHRELQDQLLSIDGFQRRQRARSTLKSKYLLCCGPEDRPSRRRCVTVSFRVPRWLSAKAHALAVAEDMTFSQFVRRGIKRELHAAGSR